MINTISTEESHMSATQQIINIGAQPNDGVGDPLRTAFSKVNNNFSNLFSTFVNTSTAYSDGPSPGQVIFETPASTFTQGVFYIQTAETVGGNSQAISLLSQLSTDLVDVSFTATGFTFFGACLSNFDMVVVNGNVQVRANPLVDHTLIHFIGSQVMWIGLNPPRLNIALDGYVNSVMATENNNNITTEQ